MKLKYFPFLFILSLSAQITMSAQYQEVKEKTVSGNRPLSKIGALRRIPFNKGWKFTLVDESNRSTDFTGALPADSAWRTIDLPHDFQFELPWIENGNKARGYKPMAEGWYRKTFFADESWKGLNVTLDFGGLIYYGDVYINGNKVASTDYGYVGFEADLSPYLNYGGENTVAVFASTGTEKGSRWYTGGGLFRDVYLSVKNPTRIARHGVFIAAEPDLVKHKADVNVTVELTNYRGKDVEVKATVYSPDGRSIKTVTAVPPNYNKHQTVEILMPEIEISDPRLWSPDTPVLYSADVVLTAGGEPIDSIRERFGIRKLEFSPDYGFKLNGEKLFLKGNSGHHDMGALGAAAFDAGIIRMMKKLKEFGYNTIRCSHNPYSENFTKIADSIGMIVVDELIDKWSDKDYWAGRKPFTEIWYKLIPEWIKRDRNSPSVIMWSLGNELQLREDWAGFQGTNDYGVTTYKIFDTLVKRFDPTRKTTVAMFPARAGGITRKDEGWMDHLDPPELACATDIASFNYQSAVYDEYMNRQPHLILFQSEAETSGLLEPFYNMDQDKTVGMSYWGSIEYWGESNGWPKKGWNFSFFDQTLSPYPEAWLVKSAFMPDVPTVRIGVIDPKGGETVSWNDVNVGKASITDHWNFPKGSTLDIVTYTNAPEVELFVNGKSIGAKKNNATENGKRNVIEWKGLEYGEGGSIKAVAIDNEGKAVEEHAILTAGKPVALKVVNETADIIANGQDLMYLTIMAVDKKGNRVPDYDGELTVTIEGEGTLYALDDADHYTDQLFKGVNSKKMRGGKMQAIIRSTDKAGKVKVSLNTPDFKKTFNFNTK